MNEITLTNFNGIETVDSRDVAKVIEKEHSKLLRDIRTYCEYLNESKIGLVDFFIKGEYTDNKGEIRPCYFCTRKGCEMIANKLTGIKGTKFTALYINAFHKMEEQLKAETEKALPQTYKQALIQLLEQVEENEKLVAENQVLLPKAEYHDEVLNKKGLITTSVIAKDLGMTPNQLNTIMFMNKIIYKQGRVWKPYVEYEWLITEEYADYQSYKADNSQPLLKWTEKGRKWIVEHITEWRNNVCQ